MFYYHAQYFYLKKLKTLFSNIYLTLFSCIFVVLFEVLTFYMRTLHHLSYIHLYIAVFLCVMICDSHYLFWALISICMRFIFSFFMSVSNFDNDYPILVLLVLIKPLAVVYILNISYLSVVKRFPCQIV